MNRQEPTGGAVVSAVSREGFIRSNGPTCRRSSSLAVEVVDAVHGYLLDLRRRLAGVRP